MSTDGVRIVTLLEGGRLTLPADMRRLHGWTAKTKLIVEEVAGGVLLRVDTAVTKKQFG